MRWKGKALGYSSDKKEKVSAFHLIPCACHSSADIFEIYRADALV